MNKEKKKETHQTLKRWGGKGEKWEYNGGGELVWNYHNETLSYY
jgi:hypothetical protein